LLIARTTDTESQTPNNYLYCGQQWDGDLGLYYNRARYLNPNTGRFWTMDTFAGNSEDPLSLHKYLYCQGNSVNGIDPSGKWSSMPAAPIHQMAIDNAYGTCLLPDSDKQILKDMQVEVDGAENQDSAHAFMHAMRDGSVNQSVPEAQLKANDRVRDLITKARNAEKGGDHQLAMQDLGRAMHTLQDSTSPSHYGFQPWYDYWGRGKNPNEWAHAAKESINPGSGSHLYRATTQAYMYLSEPNSVLPGNFFEGLGYDGVLVHCNIDI
jgi:RHS repeat-associated protein